MKKELENKIIKRKEIFIKEEETQDEEPQDEGGTSPLAVMQHQKKLERLEKKTQKKVITVQRQKLAGECARRIKILREALNLTAVEMANVCNFNTSKYTRLENAITPLTKSDGIAICISVLKRYKLVVETEWLLGKISKTPASLMNLDQVQKKVKEYTDSFLKKNHEDQSVNSTVNIFLEMEQLDRIHNKKTKFIMVNDNRLLPQYQKGDYVGGMIIPKNLWGLLKGFPCIVELKKDEKVFLRNVYMCEEEMGDYVILTTNTRDPELVLKDSILSLAVVFYHRHNGENISNILNLIHQHNESSEVLKNEEESNNSL